MSEEIWASSDEETETNATSQDRKRPLENSSPSEKEATAPPSPSSSSGDDKRSSPAKKKSRQDKKEKGRKEKKSFIDDEAEESGEDEEGSEKGEDFEEEEDQDQYEDDGMIVLDGEGSETESEDLNREKRRRGVEHTRLKRSKHLSVVEDEDLELLQDNLLQGIEQRERRDKHQNPATGTSRASAGSGEINPERVRDDDNLFEDDDEEEEELGGGEKVGSGGGGASQPLCGRLRQRRDEGLHRGGRRGRGGGRRGG